MGIPYHSIYAVDGLSGFQSDRIYMGRVNVVYSAGAGAGSAVATTVTWTEPLPTPYQVFVGSVEDSGGYVTSKTALSFVLNMTPRLAAQTLAGGTLSCLIVA